MQILKKGTWRTQNGRLLRIKEMDTDHLKNTVRMLRRQGNVTIEEWEACAYFAFSSMSGEYASMTAEQQLGMMFPSGTLSRMEHELKKRGVPCKY